MRIDFHAHVLPGCDHGSDGIRTSLRQLELAAENRVELVCATPHFYASQEDVAAFAQRRADCRRALLDAAEQASKQLPALRCGAEVLAFPGIERLPGLEQLCLEGTNLLLLEMPFTAWSDSVIESAEMLIDDPRFRVVLAHVERYQSTDVQFLLDCGAMAQINAEALNHRFLNRSIKQWLNQGKICALGSDIHGTSTGYTTWSSCSRKQPAYFSSIEAMCDQMIFG